MTARETFLVLVWVALVGLACALAGGAINRREARVRCLARTEGYRAAVDSVRAVEGAEPRRVEAMRIPIAWNTDSVSVLVTQIPARVRR